MPDYSKAKICEIKNNIDDEVYVGSTCVPLGRRMTKRRYAAKHDETLSLYEKFKELGADLFYIELIEEYPCNSKQELLAREGYYIRERGTINKRIAGRTTRQWHEEHKDGQAKQNHQRYEHKKGEVLENTENIANIIKNL